MNLRPLAAALALAVTTWSPASAATPPAPTGVRPAAIRPAALRPAVQAATAGGTVAPQTHIFQRLPIGPHILYGQIAAVNGNTISLRLRSGRVIAIDATPAITSGNYSAPLFVGKPVAADGTVLANGTFQVSHLFRGTNLGSLRPDH